MKFSITNKQNISKNCLVCGVENDFGLKTKFYETKSGEVIGIFTPHDKLQSYPNVLHGGISATILDETIGRAIMAKYGQNSFGVTMELNIRYKKPVPLNEELKVIGRMINDKGRVFEGTGELILPNGEVAVVATGKYMKRELEKIVKNDFLADEWFASDGKDLETITLGKEKNDK
ncbi:PaaI family thioesterase [Sulfurospirillum arcachonense]|uniref:PaaI family thioesterase n=1 Tax=Sulfurospirillum arcachonense TaxID=57666 RepID=UPI0004690590|nr:PaaI family thioesterase [Sulfurospirillum arcachonense]